VKALKDRIWLGKAWYLSNPSHSPSFLGNLPDLAGDSNIEGFATSNSIFHLLNCDKCKNAPSTPQELQANLRNTPNGASSGRLHSDAQVSLCKTTKELRISARLVCTLCVCKLVTCKNESYLPLYKREMPFIYYVARLSYLCTK